LTGHKTVEYCSNTIRIVNRKVTPKMPISNYSQGSSITLERLSSRSNAVSSDSSTKKQKLVFLDQSLKDVMMLVNGVQADVEAILLDPEQDGIKQITHILTQYPAVKSVHLIAHGSSGSLKLGSTELNLDNINDYAEQLKDWSKSMGGASLLIYGCEVAAGEKGINFLEQLHHLTQANLAASTAKVGSSEQGGRWQLDYQIGQITDGLAFLPFVQENYSGVFANYDEGVSGDISDDPGAPLVLQLGTGANSLRATSSAGDLEYVTVNIPEGFQLDSLNLASYNSTDDVAFAAVQRGTVFTEFGIPSEIDVSNLLGWSHINAGQVGTNILDNIGRGAGSIGFTGALPSGDYTFWFQQTGEPSTYTVEFNVSPSSNGGSEPIVSLSATPTLLKEAEGTALTLTFSLDKAPPEEGVKVYLDSNTVNALGEFDISTLAFTGGTAPELNQDASGFYFTITAQTATLTLKVLDDGEVEGTENITYTLQAGEGYTVDPNSNSTTITIQESVTTMTTVSLQTITGTFDSSDNILASNLVRSLEEGASLLTFVFDTEGEIPEGGLVVDVISDIDLTDYFTGLGRPPFSPGGQILEAIYDPETGEGIGFKFRIDQPNALVSLTLINDDAATGTVPATFTLESGEGYAVDPEASSSTVTFYDTLANVPTPTVVPEVSFSASTTDLVESEGTLLTVNFNLSEAPPAEGVLVYVAAPQQFLGDFNIFSGETEGGVFPAPNFRSTGFFFKIYEQEASITIPIFDDGETEGIEAVTLSLQAAPGYTIASDSVPITLTLSDTPESEIQVSLATTPAILLESEGTDSVHTFTLSAPPPEGGITVTVSVPNLKEFDLDAITVVGGTIAAVRENGFDLTITEQTATVNLPADDDSLLGGVQPITFTLVDGDGYQVSPTANTGSVTIVDDASQIPPPTAITEPNDIISLAVDTKLGDSYPEVSFTSRIDYNNTNRYEVDGGFLYVDASEDVDLYKVELKAGDTIKIDADSNQFAEGRKVDTWLRVFDSTGTELASNDDGAAPDEVFDAEFQSYIEFTAPADGAYYVGVSLYSNDEYDPNEPASGTGDANPAIPAINEYGPGEYTLNISLNNPDAFIAEPTEIPSGTGEGPAISLFTVAGTYGSDFDTLGFDIIAPGIAETVPEDAGSALNLVLVANGEIPEGGIEVYINSNIAFPDYFGGIEEGDYSVAYGGNLNGKPFSRGGEFLTAVYDENGQATGFKFRLEEPFATITFNPSNREEAETDGPEDVTFSIVESAGYTVSPVSSSTVTFYDTVADIPTPATTPEVSLEISPAELIESEETEFTIILSLSEPPPPEGVQVYVSGNAFDFLNEFTVFEAQFTGGLPVSDGAVSGFYFQMLEQTATITLPVFNSVEITEGIEQFNVEVRPGAGYTVNPDMGSALLTIKDTPDSQIQVTLTSEPETLIESEGTVATLNFRLSAAPPEDGITVTVSNPDLMELDLTTVQIEGAELVGVSDDNTSFTLKITEQNASVKATVYADDETEASETVTFTVEAGEGYQVDPAGSEGIFTIYDSPETAPTSTEEVNDTIGQAIATGLTAANATVTFNGEISQYFVEDEEGNELTVDASEDIDFYSFTLNAGDTVKLDVDSIAYELEGYPTQRLDSELRLFNAEGVELAANFDGYASDELFVANRDPYLEFTAEAAGTYYVGVAQWQNRVYDPLTGENSSGRINPDQGRNTGAYTLDIDLISSTPPTAVVSLTATPDLITEEEGTPVTFNFTTTGEISEEGLIIGTSDLFNPQFDFNFDFEDPQYLSGIEYYDYLESDTGEVTVLWKLTAPEAFIKLTAFDDTVAELDETFTLDLKSGEGYEIDAASASVTISDGVPNLNDPIVGISIEPTDLVEGDSLTVTLSIVDGVIPEGGLEVNVSSDIFGSLGEFAIYDEEGNFLPIYEGFAAEPVRNGEASGFIATITENTATITLNVLDDGEIEGPETFTYSLLDGEIYGVAENAGEVTITINDAPTTGGTFYGTTGDDEFDAGVDGFDGSNNWVFAGAGDDLIDSSNGGGNNRVYGQSGNDTLFIGSNDRAFGGSGEDIFYFLGGGSTISGGTDSDEFWLATADYPESANTITDFENGIDVLGIGGLGLSFDDLTLTQQGGTTLIASGEQEITKLLGINSTSLSADNFVFS
jgi:hypothetical protein